jgi:hypothetical protein
MADLTASDVSITLDPRDRYILGKLKMSQGSLDFGDGALTYPYGGVPMPAVGYFGMNKQVSMFDIVDASGVGYMFRYDQANRKIKMFTSAPAVVYEEKHTAVANLITLDYPAAWIMNVCQAGQNMAWGKSQAFGSLAANTFCVVGTIADGVRTQIYTDGATDTVYVTYATQAWAELYAQLVQEEAVTLATGAIDLANKMMAFGFCEAATTGVLLPEDIADTTAAGSVGIKMGYATGALDINAAQDAEAAVVTYLAEPASGFLADRFIEDEDPAKAGGDPYTQAFDFPLLLWCITGALTVSGGATQVIIDTATTAAAGEASINWGKGPGDLLATAGVAPTEGFVFGLKSNLTVTAGAYLKGYVSEIPGLVPLEVKDGTILQATALKFMAWGS